MSKVVVAGPRDWKDYNAVVKAIEESGFEITEIVHGAAKGVDSMAGRWAEKNNIPIKEFPAEWNNMALPGAVAKNYAKGKGVYNATAGFYRNGLMAEYGDALIAIDVGTGGTSDMIKRMQGEGKPVFKYDPRDQSDEEDVDYVF